MDYKILLFCLTFVFLVKQIDCGFDFPVNFPVIYEDPLKKYPTLREDNNGHYVLKQKYQPTSCLVFSTCDESMFPWSIDIFTFDFNDDIKFDCDRDGNDPQHPGKFNGTYLSSIEADISKKWGIDGRPELNPFDLIRLEWNRFGQCSAYYKGLDNEFKFFKKSLELFDKYHMGTILQQSNITPGKNYTYQKIFDAISKAVDGKEPVLYCDTDFTVKPTGKVLNNIAFHMDVNFNPINIQTNSNNPRPYQFCQPEDLISYPDYQDDLDAKQRSAQYYRPIA